MKITFLLRQYAILVVALSIVLVGGSVPSVGNIWAQPKGSVYEEPLDVTPPANA